MFSSGVEDAHETIPHQINPRMADPAARRPGLAPPIQYLPEHLESATRSRAAPVFQQPDAVNYGQKSGQDSNITERGLITALIAEPASDVMAMSMPRALALALVVSPLRKTIITCLASRPPTSTAAPLISESISHRQSQTTYRCFLQHTWPNVTIKATTRAETAG